MSDALKEHWRIKYNDACRGLDSFRAENEKLRAERDDLKNLLERANQRVLPGSVDTADAMVQILKERDKFKRLLESFDILKERDALAADNAACRSAIGNISRYVEYILPKDVYIICQGILSTPSPGAKLLGELKELRHLHEEARWYMQDGDLDRLEKALQAVKNSREAVKESRG